MIEESMTQPCDQKDNIAKLFDMYNKSKELIQELRVVQTKIEADVSYIKGRIDNGMGHTLDNINKKVTEFIPVLQQHSEFIRCAMDDGLISKSKHYDRVINKVEDIGWWISKILIAAILVVVVWAIANGADVAHVFK